MRGRRREGGRQAKRRREQVERKGHGRQEASREKAGMGAERKAGEAGLWAAGQGAAGLRPISLRDIGGILGLAATITSHLPSYPGGSRCPRSERNERPEGRAGTPRPGPAMSCGTCW